MTRVGDVLTCRAEVAGVQRLTACQRVGLRVEVVDQSGDPKLVGQAVMEQPAS